MKLTVQNKSLSTLKSKVSSIQSKVSSSYGFTLIELLVVIAIIGILAAALIATIDPLEQIKKSQDTTVKNTAVEYLNATTRYYATHTYFPWSSLASNTGCSTAPSASTISSMNGCTLALIGDNELKPAFTSASNVLNKIVATFNSTDQNMVVCFAPDSKSQQNDPLTKYNSTGGTATGSIKYWCTQ